MGYPFFGTNWNYGGHMFGGYGFGPGMMGWFGWGGMVMGLLILVIIIAAVLLIVRAARVNISGAGSETPLDILKKRYAKGEISKEDFDRIKKDL